MIALTYCIVEIQEDSSKGGLGKIELGNVMNEGIDESPEL